MKLNKDEMKRISSLPDDALWAEIKQMGAAYGFKLPQNAPPHEDLQKLRAAIGGTRLNVADALRVLNGYKKGAGK